MSTIKMIKADAQVSVTLGTPFINRLQTTMMFLLNELKEDQLAELTTCIQNSKINFDEPLLDCAATLMVLVRTIEKNVVDQNLFVEETISQPEN